MRMGEMIRIVEEGKRILDRAAEMVVMHREGYVKIVECPELMEEWKDQVMRETLEAYGFREVVMR